MNETLMTLPSFLALLGVTTCIVTLFHLAKLPSIAGYILTGVIVGRHFLGLVSDSEMIHVLSELGIILLLFNLGTEFSLKKLFQLKRAFFGVGLTQVIFITIIVTLGFIVFGFTVKKSLVFGAAFSLSSTAIVLKLLQSRQEINSPQGNVSIAALLFQDIWVILLLLVLPLLVLMGKNLNPVDSTLISPSLAIINIGKVILFIGGLFLFSKFLLSKILKLLVKTQIKELFFIFIIFFCLGSAWISHILGIHMALGAFLAGMMLADGDYQHHAVSSIAPFRDPFIGLFFISIGLLMDGEFLIQNLGQVLTLGIALFVLKILLTTGCGILFKYPLRISLLAGIYLAQIGEFSFLFASEAKTLEIITTKEYQLILSTTLFLMILSPIAMNFLPKWISQFAYYDSIKSSLENSPANPELTKKLEDTNHVIILGFGINGQNLAQVLKHLHIPYKILDLNLDSVKKWQKEGEPIHFGDAIEEDTLREIGIQQAKCVVVAISDLDWVNQVVAKIRHMRPDIHIVVRSQYLRGAENLKKMGANDIVIAEIESSFEIFARVLKHYGFNQSQISDYLNTMDKGTKDYVSELKTFDPHMTPYGWMSQLASINLVIEEGSQVSGKSLKELQLRNTSMINIVAIHSNDAGFFLPNAETILEENDRVYLVGDPNQIDGIKALFQKHLDSDDGIGLNESR